ncbi:hypothetical protein [Sinomonas mesophila]|uniref:hypothetical protein n=1 Tax=Sinomonas mesophila TaxID=1531955 RepID=UPI0009877F91|nr:hypothetical protein [Sinomonas mesophila]
MSTHHSDGVGEIVDDMLRQALMVAARLGEIAARARQEHLAKARAESERQARELAARFEAERGAARSSLAGVGSDSWWARADPERVAAAYKTAASWAGEDAEMAETLRQMDEQLAARGVHVTPSMPERVDDLLRSRAWVAEHDPFMDEAWTREMAQARTPEERDRLNVALVSAWLARPEAQQANDAANELDAAKAWAKENHPDWFNQWDLARAYADSVESTKADDRELIQRWKTETGQLTQPNTPAAVQAASTAATWHHFDGDRAMGRAQEWAQTQTPDGPSAEDLARPTEQQQREETLADNEWDTAERREEFASSLQGLADRAAVEARVLADVSQGTHPRQAVAAAPRNAPEARTNNSVGRKAPLTKGSR